jgi:hypothetical protein
MWIALSVGKGAKVFIVERRSPMVQAQIELREEQLETLRSSAAALNVSISELVRRAVDALSPTPARSGADERRHRALAVAGRFSSGHSDIAENHDAYLAEAFDSCRSS